MSDIDGEIRELKTEIEEYENYMTQATSDQQADRWANLINGARASLTKLYELKASQGM